MEGRLFVGVFLTAIIHCGHAVGIHYYVSPTGSDTNNGTSTPTPFNTIGKAISLASSSSNKGKDVYIELMPGYHDQKQTLHINHHANSLTIRSFNNQEVHVTGGKQILPSSLRPVTDSAILNALPAAARSHVKYVHLPSANITNYGSMHEYGSGGHRYAPLELFQNGQPLRLARWPNKGYINIAGTPNGRLGRTITYNSTRPASWKHLDDVWVYGFWFYSWSERAYPVNTLDVHNMTITFSNKTNIRQGFRKGQLGISQHREGGFFRFFNVLSELDEPGEYYIDRKTGNLYMWVPTGSVKSSDVIYASMINTCVVINPNIHNVVLSGFIIETCRDRGVYARSVSNVQLNSLEIRNTGDYAVYLDGAISSCTLSKCLVHDSDGGVRITGGGRNTLISSGNIIEDCRVYRTTRASAVGRAAVWVQGVGNLVRYTEISDTGGTAIQFYGNDHIFEYNNIHHVCKGFGNCGAVDSKQDWTFRGNKLRYNTIHDVVQYYPGNGARGVNLETLMSSLKIYNNVFYNNDIHVTIVGGRDNVVTNNVMYNATQYDILVTGSGRNMNARTYKDLVHKLHSVPFNGSLWTSRYPQLAAIVSHNASLPEGNEIDKNLIYKVGHEEVIHGLTGWLNSPVYYNVTETGYSYGERDHFDVKHGDFRVKCHAAEWANHVNFEQVVSPNDVGPRYDVGPSFHKIAHHSVPLTGSATSCPTHAPARTAPMPSFLPDGSGQTPVFKVFDEGCWMHVDKCTNDPDAVGTYRDMYGERFTNATTDEAECLKRAAEQWRFCGSNHGEAVIAVYGPTGATTYGGDGCYQAQYGCPTKSGPKDGHVIPGHIYRDVYAEQRRNAGHNEERCLARALELWKGCGSFPNHPVTSIYRPTGATRTAGAGCWIGVEKCPKVPNLNAMFYDADGATNALSDDVKEICFERAEYYWRHCGSDNSYPVTAYYRPTTQSTTFPLNV